MKRSGHGVQRTRLLDWPAVLLVAMWLGLWCLWPSPERAAAGPRRRPATAISEYRGVVQEDAASAQGPLAFFKSAAPDFNMGEGGREGPSVTDLRRPVFLARGRAASAGETAVVPFAAADGAVQLGTYRLKDGPVPAFREKPTAGMRIVSDVAETLKARGYTLPDIAPESIRQVESPWEAVLYVSCGVDGRTENVFLEKATADKDLNATLVRALYQGSLSKPGSAVGGRVTISYGRE